MKSQTCRRESLGRAPWILLVILGLGFSGLTGCQKSDAPKGDGAEAIQTPVAEKGSSEAPAGENSLVAVDSGATGDAGNASATTADAQATLEAMVKAYKTAKTYADRGQVRVTGQFEGQTLDGNAYFLVALERPNKIRVQAYRGTAVSDGQKLWAFVDNLANQVLESDAQPELGLDWLFRDQGLALAMADGFTLPFSWAPMQTILLLANDPLKTILHDAGKPQIDGSEKVESHDCYKITAKRPDGTITFWIDKKSFVLRRFAYPTEGINQAMAGGKIKGFSVVADFVEAELNGRVDPNAFEFQVSDDAEKVDLFLSPDVALLGKPAPDFTFTGLDGKPVTRESLAGKVAVLDVWATWCQPCRMSLPLLEKVYQAYKDNDKVAFLAVNVDDPKTEDKALTNVFEEAKINLPIARDTQQQTALMAITSIPAMLLLDAEGKVQDLEMGLQGRMDIDLPAKIDRVLKGENLYDDKIARFKRQQQDFEAWLKDQVASDSYWNPLPMGMEPPQTEIAARTEPKALKLKSLWNLKDLKSPGNIVVVPQDGGEPKVLVLDEGKAIVELSADGKIVEKHTLKLPGGALANFLRTTTDRDGKRWYVCGANGLQQIHLFDEKFQHVWDYPKNINTNQQGPGIADAQIGDLDGDGTPEICLGYWDIVGAQGVSMEGKRIWANKSLANVLRVAILGADAHKKRNVLCTNQRGTLVALDSTGKAVGEISLPDLMLSWVVAADVAGDGELQLCALAPTPEGALSAVGLTEEGKQLWTYPLPPGIHEKPIEPVSIAHLLAGDAGQWLLVAPDGSIHVVAADGTPIDQFNYGNAVTGIAGLKWDGHYVLLVSTDEGLDAWEVEAPEK